MTISSKSWNVWASTDSMLGLMQRPRPYVGKTTEKKGRAFTAGLKNDTE
jgi:hypothetical protein